MRSLRRSRHHMGMRPVHKAQSESPSARRPLVRSPSSLLSGVDLMSMAELVGLPCASLILSVALLFSPRLAQADETCPASAAQLAATASELQRAFLNIDDEGLVRSGARLQSQQGCLTDTPTPAEVATVHLALAMSAFVGRSRGDEAAALNQTRAHLRAAMETDPTVLPQLCAGLPQGHPLCELVGEVQGMPASPRAPAEAPPWLDLTADGRADATLPTERDALSQLIFREEVCWSGLRSGALSRELLQPCRQARQRHQSRGLLIASGAVGVTAVGLLGVSGPAVVQRYQLGLQIDDCNYACTDLVLRASEVDDRYYRMTPVFTAGLASAAGAIGLVTTGLVLRW